MPGTHGVLCRNIGQAPIFPGPYSESLKALLRLRQERVDFSAVCFLSRGGTFVAIEGSITTVFDTFSTELVQASVCVVLFNLL